MTEMVSLNEPLRDSGSAETAGSPTAGRQRKRWAILRRPLAVASLVYLVVLVLAAVAAPLVAPYDPGELNLTNVLSGPTLENLLGTDPLGRDVLSRLIFGGRVSFVNAGIATLTFLFLGVSSGIVAGFLGGWSDRIFTWIVDLLIAIPALIVLMVVVTIFGGNMMVAMVALGILSAPGFARVVRSATLTVRQELYVSAARVSGLPNRHLVVRHVLPQVTGPILVHGSLFCGAALLIDGGLGYLGIGVPPATPTWGQMIAEASTVIQQQAWLLFPPGVTLGLATLAFALLGDAVRDTRAERSGRAVMRPVHVRSRPAAENTSPGSEDLQASAPALLRLESVTVTLPAASGPVAVTQDVDLYIESGETVGLVGESGCGKSMVANAILGMLPAGATISAGSIYFDGVDVVAAGTRAVRRLRGSQIAMISQEPIASLDPTCTVGQLLGELVMTHQGTNSSSTHAKVSELLSAVALPDPERVARRYPHELSGGMAQRVAIALALAGEPRLLIADEPTTALDVTVQGEILQLLRDIQNERGMAVLLISHDWGVVAQNCRRAYVMYAGQVVESCSASDVFYRPAHPYTVGLLSSTPYRVEPGQDIPAIGGTVPSPGQWPSGCHFAPRCYLATDECRTTRIPLLDRAPDHHTRCIHHDLIPTSRPTDEGVRS